MSKRDRKRRQRPTRPIPQPPTTTRAGPRRSWERVGWAVAGAALLVLVVSLVYRNWPAAADEPNTKRPVPEPIKQAPKHETPGPNDGDDFLSEFNTKEPAKEKGGVTPVLSDVELEKRFTALADIYEQVMTLKAQRRDFAKTVRLQEQFDQEAKALEDVVAKAKAARPDAAVPRWLTGELLMLVGGEPEEIMPHLEFALKHGLRRPRLLASVARAHLESNRFADALRLAEDALAQAGQNRYVWETYNRVAFSNQRFADLCERLDRAFPSDPPDWVRKTRDKARLMQEHWDQELKVRAAEAKADDLPRVRLVIEHRRFARDPDGKPLTTVETTGRGNVVIELFENEAPQTVANFIDLVSRGTYDGTRFHLAVAATLVVGGDPQSRQSDTADDGTGGPGYVIPDEFDKPGARRHFRGSLSMANTGPHTAGSQFFFCVAPAPGADGRHTVFGRVIEGQDVVDHITRGKTTRKLEVPGRLIPGDVLVRAEVLRKRNHEYRATKE